MADVVNYYLERMLPELEDLERRGLFTRSEIKEIVRRRRDFEYKIKRGAKVKDDFLRYIEYEQQLEKLRLIRKKVLVQSLKASGEEWVISASDKASVTRITGIFHRAVTKFKGDLSLWLQYLEYCKSKSKKRVQQVLGKALQLHPNVPGLWMYASAWEFQHNENMTAARALMQKGLRLCARSEELFLEYFRMEITYFNRMKARKVVLGAQFTKENDAQMQLSIKMATAVYQNAIAEIPSSSKFRQRFVEVLDDFDMGNSTIATYICGNIAADFSADEQSWNWRARRHLKQGENGRKQAQEVFEKAVLAVPSALMLELYASFLEELLNNASEEDESQGIATRLQRVYEDAEQKSPSIDLVEEHIRFLAKQGLLDRAKEVASRFCKGNYSGCSRLWTLRLSLEIQTAEARDEDVLKLLKQAVRQVEISNAQDLWHLAMQYFCSKEEQLESLLHLLEVSLGSNGGEGGAPVAIAAVDMRLLSHGVKKARQLYNRFLSLPGPGLQLYLHCIAFEARQATMGYPEALGNMRKVFDAALEIHGKHNDQLWLHYCTQERTIGTAEAATRVYLRAKKTLLDPSWFVQRHQLMFS